MTGPTAAPSLWRLRLARTFKQHLVAYVALNVVLTGINIYTGAPWWAVWPLLIWGFLLMLHFLIYRATSVEDAWVEERMLDLRSKSYDMGHIDDIRKHPAPSIKDDKGGSPPSGAR